MASLALVFASLLGSAAHACESSHHSQHRHQGHVGQSHTHGGLAHTLPERDSEAAAAAAGSGPHAATAAVDHPEPDSTDGKHACCMDFICHGCIAIMTSAVDAQFTPWQEARSLPWDGKALASVSPARLDRPPKTLVSA